MTNHEWHLQEPHFTDMKIGKKIYEMRVYDEKRRKINIGDKIKLLSEDFDSNGSFSVIVVEKIIFDNFRNALRDIGIRKILPSIKTLNNGVELYEKFPHKEGTYKDGAKKFGVVRFKVSVNNTPKIHVIHMKNPTEHLMFDYIKNGTKTVIGKILNETFGTYISGDKIKFICKNEEIMTLITDIKRYENVENYLRKETLKNTLPHTRTVKEGIDIYKNMVSFEEIDELCSKLYFGFLGIHILVIND